MVVDAVVVTLARCLLSYSSEEAPLPLPPPLAILVFSKGRKVFCEEEWVEKLSEDPSEEVS